MFWRNVVFTLFMSFLFLALKVKAVKLRKKAVFNLKKCYKKVTIQQQKKSRIWVDNRNK